MIAAQLDLLDLIPAPPTTACPAPNAHGVYPPSEHLELPNPTKGWRGCPLASIEMLRLPDGWWWATSSALPGGSGHAFPLTRDRRGAATRWKALSAAIGSLRHRMSDDDTPAARAVARWLEGIPA